MGSFDNHGHDKVKEIDDTKAGWTVESWYKGKPNILHLKWNRGYTGTAIVSEVSELQ